MKNEFVKATEANAANVPVMEGQPKVCVIPEYQNRGIGQQAVLFIEK